MHSPLYLYVFRDLILNVQWECSSFTLFLRLEGIFCFTCFSVFQCISSCRCFAGSFTSTCWNNVFLWNLSEDIESCLGHGTNIKTTKTNEQYLTIHIQSYKDVESISSFRFFVEASALQSKLSVWPLLCCHRSMSMCSMSARRQTFQHFRWGKHQETPRHLESFVPRRSECGWHPPNMKACD